MAFVYHCAAIVPLDLGDDITELRLRKKQDEYFFLRIVKDAYLRELLASFTDASLPDSIKSSRVYQTLSWFVECALKNRTEFAILQKQRLHNNIHILRLQSPGYAKQVSDAINTELSFVFALLEPFARHFSSLQQRRNEIRLLLGKEATVLQRGISQPLAVVL